MDTPASRIIERLGGVLAVAEITGVHHTRVRRWTYPPERGGTGGTIPQRHFEALIAAAKARGIRLKPADFFPKEAA